MSLLVTRLEMADPAMSQASRVPAGLTLGVSCFLRVSLVLQSFLGPRHKANACAAYQEQCLLCHLLLWGAGRSSCHREAGEVDAPFIDILRRKAGTLEM